MSIQQHHRYLIELNFAITEMLCNNGLNSSDNIWWVGFMPTLLMKSATLHTVRQSLPTYKTFSKNIVSWVANSWDLSISRHFCSEIVEPKNLIIYFAAIYWTYAFLLANHYIPMPRLLRDRKLKEKIFSNIGTIWKWWNVLSFCA